MRIHTIGDSHSYSGMQYDGIVNHHLGPKLCYSFGRDGINLTNYGINPGDILLFCLGEIDCRCHIHKHITEENDYKSVINSIVNNYFIAIKNAVKDFNDVKISIYNVVPPIQKHNTEEDPEYPFLGTDEERRKYVLYFNQCLKEKCIEYKYIFFDVYNDYSDINGFLNKSLSDNRVHIHDSTYTTLFIKNNFK